MLTVTQLFRNFPNFYPYQPNVESHTTALSVLPGPVSSSNRHLILQNIVLVFPKLVL